MERNLEIFNNKERNEGKRRRRRKEKKKEIEKEGGNEEGKKERKEGMEKVSLMFLDLRCKKGLRKVLTISRVYSLFFRFI